MGVAVWLCVEGDTPRVLLKQRHTRKYGEIYEPLIKGWVNIKEESPKEAARREAVEMLGEKFVWENLTTNQHPFPELFPISKEKFPLGNGIEGVRHHYLGRITPGQLSLILQRLDEVKPYLRVRLIEEKDLLYIRHLGDPNIENDDLVFYREECEIVLYLLLKLPRLLKHGW